MRNHTGHARSHWRVSTARRRLLTRPQPAATSYEVTRALHVIIAAMLAMAVPVSQLRTMSVRIECCCPDPDQCHCPDDAAAKPLSGQPSMRSCHRSTDILASSVLPELDAPWPVELDAPYRRVVTTLFALRLPHDPPSPARPPAPS